VGAEGVPEVVEAEAAQPGSLERTDFAPTFGWRAN